MSSRDFFSAALARVIAWAIVFGCVVLILWFLSEGQLP